MSAPPPLPDGTPTRTILVRALLALALVPLILVLANLLPPEQQWVPVMAAFGLVVLVPFVHLILGVAAFVRGESGQGWTYVAVAFGAAVIGFGACTATMMSFS